MTGAHLVDRTVGVVGRPLSHLTSCVTKLARRVVQRGLELVREPSFGTRPREE